MGNRGGSSPVGPELQPLVTRINAALDSIVGDLHATPSQSPGLAAGPVPDTGEARRLVRELSEAVAEVLSVIAGRAGHPGIAGTGALASLEDLVAALKVVPQVDHDLLAALRGLTRRLSEADGPPIQLVALESWPRRFPAGVSLAIYRLVEDLVGGADGLSGLTTVRIVLSAAGDHALVRVEELYDRRPARLRPGRMTAIRVRTGHLRATLHLQTDSAARIWNAQIPLLGVPPRHVTGRR